MDPRMQRLRGLAASLALLVSYGATAQQPGTPAYNSVFLPAHGVGDTVQTAWEDRWGSYASGKFDPSFGASTTGASFNFSTSEAAEAEALRVCAQRGGIDCSIVITTQNACLAVATGAKGYLAEEETLRKARRKALKGCGTDCRILWEGCSLPVRKR